MTEAYFCLCRSLITQLGKMLPDLIDLTIAGGSGGGAGQEVE